MTSALHFIWASIVCIFVFIGFVLLLPVQTGMWLLDGKPWGETEPYSRLNYALYRAWDDSGSPPRPYQEWKQDRWAGADDPEVDALKQRIRELRTKSVEYDAEVAASAEAAEKPDASD